MMKYKGYIGEASFDDDTKMYEGSIINAMVGTFAAKKSEDLEKEFRKTIDVYLKVCEEKTLIQKTQIVNEASILRKI